MKYLMIISLFSLITCASTPEESAPAPYIEAPKEEAKTELTQEEKDTIDKKLENLKKLPIRNLIENVKTSQDYERKQSWAALEEVLNRKLLALLKKEFPDSKDVLELPIYNPTGEENYFKLVLKDLYMLYISKNAETGDSITKKNLDLKRNKKEKTVAVFLNPPGARESQEITFKVYNGKLILSSYRSGMEVNPRGYEYVVPEIISMLSLKENGYVPSLKNINQEKVDSIK
ncbi:MAG: hypothetical protein IPO06_28755 [Leptospiraceae bacterium]|nr:hypothetical protein [Leptospiraceae bacterium]MBK9503297.1 hypothetical protein [Leptospiraceae bacterium]